MDSNIAVNLQNYQQQSLAERQQLKRLVLQNEARQEQSEVQCGYFPTVYYWTLTCSACGQARWDQMEGLSWIVSGLHRIIDGCEIL
jgi:hypothetical protein